MTADLTHVDTWIFDLDNTLYPPERELLQAVNDKMTAYTMRVTGLGWDDALALQLKYHHELGTTLAGPVTGYAFVYGVEILLLLGTLVALGPLVRASAPDHPHSPRFGLAEFPI